MIKHFLYIYIYFIYKKNVTWILSKNERKASKKASERYQNLSEEEKNKKQKYGCEQCRFFLKKKETKSIRMVMNDIEIFQKIS